MDSYASRLALQLVPLLAARYCATLEGHVFVGPLFCDENSEKADELSKVRNRKSAAQVAAYLHPQFVEQHRAGNVHCWPNKREADCSASSTERAQINLTTCEPSFFLLCSLFLSCTAPVLTTSPTVSGEHTLELL